MARQQITFLTGIGVGAALMYMFDVEEGGRRRAVARDKTAAALRRSGRGLARTSRSVGNRVRGVAAEMRARWLRRREVPDQVLEDRVRARLGHLVENPGSLEVRAHNGDVTLSGPVLAGEAAKLVRKLSRVRGVRKVDNRLQAFGSPEDVSALQAVGIGA